MRVTLYFFFVALFMIVLGIAIKPQFNNEIILGISTPWLISSVEFFIVNKVHVKKVELTTKVLIYGFIVKMLVFGVFLASDGTDCSDGPGPKGATCLVPFAAQRVSPDICAERF